MFSEFVLCADELIQYEAYFTLLAIDEHSEHTLEIERSELKALWEAFRQAYCELIKNPSPPNGDKSDKADKSSTSESANHDIVSIKMKYRSVYKVYVSCLASINSMMDIKKNINVSTPSPSATIATNEHHLPSIKLPPCDIDVFYGDYITWPTFRDLFTALYRNNPRLSPIEKLYHLIGKTRDEARAVVKTAPMTNEGFSLAWENLVDRYENRRILINSQLKILLNLTPIEKETGTNIKKLQRTINDCITTLKTLDIPVDGWDPIFVFLCSTRLPNATLGLWEQSLDHKNDLPPWKDLDHFLTNRYQALESVYDMKGTPSSVNPGKNNPNKSREPSKGVNAYHSTVNQTSCVLCPETHALRLCPVFIQMSPEERYTIVKKQRLCINCLASSHEIRKCKSKFFCSVCRKRHHTLLHYPNLRDNIKSGRNLSHPQNHVESANPQSSNFHDSSAAPSYTAQSPLSFDPNPKQSQTFVTGCCPISGMNEIQTRTVLGTAKVNILIGGMAYSTRALIDPASEATFISERLQQTLHIKTCTAHTQITGLNETVSALSTKTCTIAIGSPVDPAFTLTVNAFIIKKLTGNLPSISSSNYVNSNWNDLMLADSNSSRGTKIDLLLGGNIYGKILKQGVRICPEGQLVAQETVFGWVITGETSSHPNPSVVSFFNSVDLDRQILKFWKIEEPPKVRKMSESDLYCEELYRNTTFRNHENRYVVSLPFKQSFGKTISLGASRTAAYSQFLKNERRLSKNPASKSQYESVLGEYLSLGHMVGVNPPINNPPSQSYYLPHHAVIKPESTTTKLRVVFNASCPSSNGNSLNDLLYCGPTLQADLTTLILKWRLYRFVFNADIEKMYRQILVHPKHTPFQRLLFRATPDSPIQDYELQTVTFGVNCAPYLAIRSLIQLAEENSTTYPEASYILQHSMYVDDVLAGDHTIERTLKARDDLIRVLKSAGFVLRKWAANDEKLLVDLPPKDLLDSEFLKLSENSTTKTLGLRWNAGCDYFYFCPLVTPNQNTATKRGVLAEIAKLFDPAGWLAPKIIVAKILMQQIWIDKTGWDDVLKSDTLQRWYNFVQDYSSLKLIKIPRWLKFNPEFFTEMHGFCDASIHAYAATIYVRTIDMSGNISVQLLTAKTRVAPINQKTIPQLELCGAELLARLASTIRTELSLSSHNLFLWTDSTIVLAWLMKPPCHWQTFVGNRVSIIAETVGCNNWFHVESKENPADLASRGTSALELAQNSLWWNGPQWLSQPSEKWKTNITSRQYETNLEAKGVKSYAITTHISEDILLRFSSFPRALRVLSYIFRFYHLTHPISRTQTHFNSIDLQAFELKFVKNRLITLSQKQFFGTEYHSLLKRDPIPQKSPLLSLNPFLDSQRIMRVNGRLARSPVLTHDEKFPVLLPYAGSLTRLLLEFIHKLSIHGENQLMFRLVRMEYWIPKLKNLIRSLIRSCKVCVLHKHKLTRQIMAALPPERASLTRPFCQTGVDFAGPFEIKTYSGRGCRMTKGYVLVFVCFSTKAIHLEATSEMSTPVFLAAFARFCSRRGCPSTIFSDNGTTFVGASRAVNKDLKDVIRHAKNDLITSQLGAELEWKFIPPGAPHMGGLWEAGVKSFKTHLKKVNTSQKYTFEEFSTLLSRIEACLNSRPISPMSEDPTDIAALTPGHFLIGGPILSPPDPDLSTQPLSVLNRWQKVKRLHQLFAQRWKDEYLKELHRRYKWQYPEKDVCLGDLVVVRQENLPPVQWRLGRIQKTYYGEDARVRVVDILTSRGVITRPVVKLVVLPLNTNPSC